MATGDVKISFREATLADDFATSTNVAGSHKLIRLGFLRKVYGILSLQLVFTVVFTAATILNDPLNLYLKENPGLATVAVFGSFVSLLGLLVMRSQVPVNYCLLAAFTLCESVVISSIVSVYEKAEVLEAFVLTASLTLAITLFTLQSKYDYSSWAGGLFASLWILLGASFAQIIIRSAFLDFVLCTAGALVFCLFIIYDTHLLMHQYSPEEYMLAAVSLYVDIINLFLHILRIIGKMRD